MDRAESIRRGSPPRKASNTEKAEAKRFVQIKTVLLMSDAWRDCDYSARCAFLEFSARLKWATGQPEPTNNGRLWLTRDEWLKAGFAPATVTRSIQQLIKTGLIYRARTGGIGRGCSEYALTCYAPTKDSTGLFFNGFRKDAWAKYSPLPEKTHESKVNRDRFKNDSLPLENSEYRIKSEPSARIKSVHQESESTSLQGDEFPAAATASRPRKPLTSPLAIRLSLTADRGHLRLVA